MKDLMSESKMDFGYHPRSLSLTAGPVTVTTLPNLDELVDELANSEGVEDGWIYAPLQPVRDFLTGDVRQRPYSARVFGLPQTHSITHAAPDSAEHVDFHLWLLSFFTGMRLTATEAGFLDATPIVPGKLTDFLLLDDLSSVVDLAERFWIGQRNAPERARLVAAAIHALFMAQGPQSLQFERFIYGYTALDACYALRMSTHPGPRAVSHAARIEWLCNEFNMPVPAWARSIARASAVSELRNAALHEALFAGAPLGFALHGASTNLNLPLEMTALTCRLLVALLGAEGNDYVRSPVTSRQRHGLRLN